MTHHSFKPVFLGIYITLAASLNTFGQFVPSKVERSSQVILHQGDRYYVHTVQQGHTLYSICKAYNANEKELQRANPGIDLKTLSIGQALKIPAPKQESSADLPSIQHSSQDRYIQHIVKAKETPYSLSKQYKVPLEEIYKHNPESRQGIRIGQIVLIPQILQAPAVPLKQEETFSPQLYEVKQGDTLFRISRNLGVTINNLFYANPDLRWGLKTGQKLVIPSEESNEWMTHKRMNDSIFTVFSQMDLSKYQCDSIATLKRMRPPVKVALLLPFLIEESLNPDTTRYIDSTGVRIRPKKRGLAGRVAAEFYEGILLALDSLSQEGIDISLFTYDTEADTNRTKEILDELNIVEPNLIIGPLAENNIKLVSKFSFEHQTPFIPPLVEDESVFKNNPSAFRIMPTELASYSSYAKHIATKLDTTGLTLVYKNNVKYNALADTFKTFLIKHTRSDLLKDSLFFRSVVIDDSLLVNLDSSFYDSVMNRVLILSSYEPDVINTLSQLHYLLRDHEIEVYGFPAWQKFKNARIDVIHELQTTLYTPFHIDYDDRAVKGFVSKCRSQLKTEPYKTSSAGINYTYLGYDLAMYFIKGSHHYGSNLCKCSYQITNPQLLSKYKFNRSMVFGSLENRSISILKYTRDYEVIKLN